MKRIRKTFRFEPKKKPHKGVWYLAFEIDIRLLIMFLAKAERFEINVFGFSISLERLPF